MRTGLGTCVALPLACVVVAATPGRVHCQVLTDVLVWEAELRLSETPEALVSSPNLRDPRGGWLYWDRRGSQLRRYDESGALLMTWGRSGEGPGEFQRLVGADVLRDGRVVALDGRGQLSVWSATSGTLEFEFQSGVASPYGMQRQPQPWW